MSERCQEPKSMALNPDCLLLSQRNIIIELKQWRVR